MIRTLWANYKILMLAIMFLAAAWAFTFSRSDTIADDTSKATSSLQQAELVTTYQPSQPIFDYNIYTSGRLIPKHRLTIVGEVSGKIVYINPNFEAGKRVNKGDILLKVNDALYKADVKAAEASLASAKAMLIKAALDYERANDLLKKGTAAKALYDTAKSAKQSAIAQVQQAKALKIKADEMLMRTEIKAPFDSLIISETVTLDSFVSPGMALADIMDSTIGEIAISLLPDDITKITRTYQQSKNKVLKVIARPGNGSVGTKTITGAITRLSPSIETRTRTAVIYAEFDNAFIESNTGQVFANDFMSVEIKINSEKPVWQIPVALIRRNDHIWNVTKESKLHQIPLKIVAVEGETALVQSGTALTNLNILETNLPNEIEGKLVTLDQSN